MRLEAEQIQLQLREAWRDSSAALELHRDDFEKVKETKRTGAAFEGVKEITEVLEETQIEDL